jgi:hypothetical protein
MVMVMVMDASIRACLASSHGMAAVDWCAARPVHGRDLALALRDQPIPVDR